MNIKVADFGFSENLYSRAYVRTAVDGGVRLPVKWMAPESILDGVFSEKTDVVCYYFLCCYNLVHLSSTKLAYTVIIHINPSVPMCSGRLELLAGKYSLGESSHTLEYPHQQYPT